MTVADEIFRWGSAFSPVFPLLFVWNRFSREQRVIVAFIGASFASDLLTLFVIRYEYLLRNVLAQLYGFVEAALLLFFYSLILKKGKAVVYTVGALYLTYYVINSLLWEVLVFNPNARAVEAIVMIFLALAFFYQIYQQEEEIFIEHSPLFWINIALLVYFAGAFFSFALSREIVIDPKLTWKFHNFSNILKNILLGIALWKVPRQPRLTKLL
jgi:sterol desaturase/sphingolipid hydroxylase (fatty acid hydroxylase superfamily)